MNDFEMLLLNRYLVAEPVICFNNGVAINDFNHCELAIL